MKLSGKITHIHPQAILQSHNKKVVTEIHYAKASFYCKCRESYTECSSRARSSYSSCVLQNTQRAEKGKTH